MNPELLSGASTGPRSRERGRVSDPAQRRMNFSRNAMAGFAPTHSSSVRSTTYQQS
jgi:hypothetical protein